MGIHEWKNGVVDEWTNGQIGEWTNIVMKTWRTAGLERGRNETLVDVTAPGPGVSVPDILVPDVI